MENASSKTHVSRSVQKAWRLSSKQRESNVVFESNGNLFGTTGFVGPGGYGTGWEITP